MKLPNNKKEIYDKFIINHRKALYKEVRNRIIISNVSEVRIVEMITLLKGSSPLLEKFKKLEVHDWTLIGRLAVRKEDFFVNKYLDKNDIENSIFILENEDNFNSFQDKIKNHTIGKQETNELKSLFKLTGIKTKEEWFRLAQKCKRLISQLIDFNSKDYSSPTTIIKNLGIDTKVFTSFNILNKYEKDIQDDVVFYNSINDITKTKLYSLLTKWKHKQKETI